MKIFGLLETQYNNFKQRTINYLNEVLDKNQIGFNSSSVLGQIINVLSASMQNLMLYIEDAFIEQNKYTAQRKKSIYGLASLAGYQPSLGKAATVQVKLSYIPNNINANNIIINHHEPLICTQNGLQYNLILPQEAIVMSIDKDSSNKSILAVEGMFETQTFISSGGNYYTQNIKYVGNIDTDYMDVYVNNVKYEYCSSIYDMDPYGHQYSYKVGYKDGIDLIFGNDVYGLALRDGDSIKVTYLLHNGTEGNLSVDNKTYFVFNNNLSTIDGETVDGNSIFTITFATQDSVASGADSEKSDQVREMIGMNSRGLVLSSPENYKWFLSKFSFVGYNRTWSDPGNLIVNSLIMKNYKIMIDKPENYFELNENDFKLTDMQKKSIIQSLEKQGNQFAGASYNIIDPKIRKYAIFIYIKSKQNSYDKNMIESQIKNIIGEFFMNIKSDIFIPKSDIIQVLKNKVDIIDSIDIYFLSEQNEVALQTKTYDKEIKMYDSSTGLYSKQIQQFYLYDGENPNLGLDEHGNILLESDEEFPVLMGGWDYLNNEDQEVVITSPVNIYIN